MQLRSTRSTLNPDARRVRWFSEPAGAVDVGQTWHEATDFGQAMRQGGATQRRDISRRSASQHEFSIENEPTPPQAWNTSHPGHTNRAPTISNPLWMPSPSGMLSLGPGHRAAGTPEWGSTAPWWCRARPARCTATAHWGQQQHLAQPSDSARRQLLQRELGSGLAATCSREAEVPGHQSAMPRL